jgi:hypothetical protein
MSFLYRLAGPPQKLRWTYQLVPDLTLREAEGISKINQMRLSARLVPYDVYEEPDEDER